MKKYLNDILSLFILLLVVAYFFSDLFWPIPKLIITPDFGTIDAWHRSFSLKYLAWQKLHNFQLPLWTSLIGGGQPLLADALGFFYLPNLVFFALFDSVTAYNLLLVFSITTLGWGTYIWFRSLTLSPVPSLFAGLTMAFSGLAIPRLTHVMVIPALSLIPWVMLVTGLMARSRSAKTIAIWALVTSQQLLINFPQASFITLSLALIYYFYLTSKNKNLATAIVRLIIATLLMTGLTSIQLLPALEFYRNSSVAEGFSPGAAAYFAFPPVHLLTFLNPYALGRPQNGTYPNFVDFNGSIYWENIGFVGFLPLVFFFFQLFLLLRKKLEPSHFRLTIWSVSMMFIYGLLMLGQNSPLYLIYSVWPLNIFRTPSRFLWPFVFCLVLVSSQGLAWLWQKSERLGIIKLLIVLGVAVNTFQLFEVWQSYHAKVPARDWLKAPQVVNYLPRDGRVYSLGTAKVHNQTFLSQGWQNLEPYFFLRNGLDPNSNVLWQISHHNAYAGVSLRRSSLADDLLSSQIAEKEKGLIVSRLGQKLLDLFSIRTIITTLPLEAPNITSVTSMRQRDQVLNIYNNKTALPRVYLATEVVRATTIEQALVKLQEEIFIPGKTVLWETMPPQLASGGLLGSVELSESSDQTSLEIKLTNNQRGAILVLTDSYYPGWQAYIDGQITSIYPVNIRQRGLIVPTGDHQIVFQYKPTSLIWGTGITLASLIITWILMVFPPFVDIARIGPSVSGLFGHHQGSHEG